MSNKSLIVCFCFCVKVNFSAHKAKLKKRTVVKHFVVHSQTNNVRHKSFAWMRRPKEKLGSLTSTKNMTVGAKNNYAQAIKLDLTFLSFGFYIFEVFSSLLNSRRRLQDVQTETIRSERADNHLCRRALGMLNSKIKK